MTLIEIVIYIGILSTVVFLISNLVVMTTRLVLNVSANSSLNNDLNYISARLRYDLGRATSISNPSTTGISTNDLSLTINNETYTFDGASGASFTLTEPSGTYQLNSKETTVVSNFTLIGDPGDAKTIKIDLTLTSLNQIPAGNKTLSSTLYYALHF